MDAIADEMMDMMKKKIMAPMALGSGLMYFRRIIQIREKSDAHEREERRTDGFIYFSFSVFFLLSHYRFLFDFCVQISQRLGAEIAFFEVHVDISLPQP